MLAAMRQSFVPVQLVVLLGCSSVLGCGTNSSVAPVGIKPVASNLAGNWLLAGSLPESPFQFPSAPGTQLSVTFSTVGNQIVGSGMFQVGCPSGGSPGQTGFGGIGGGFVASGTVADDGKFVAQSPATTASGVAITSLSLSGTVPSTAGGTWSGSYTINTNGDGGCVLAESASLTAEPIQPFSGTFVASGTYTSGATKSPVSVTMTLQQGTTSTGAGGAFLDEAYVLSGSLSVTGVPCFQTGVSVAPATPQPTAVGGAVFGAMAFPAFKMNDGSLVVINVGANDGGVSQLDALPLGISGGNCASTPGGSQLQVGTFVRQK